jgi:quinol monooxygenase YgiN/predicted GNAT family acetyltransferase
MTQLPEPQQPVPPRGPQLQVIARYSVTFGNELEVASLLSQLADATRAEPGNLSFATYRQLDDEREIVLLERYASLNAFTAHRATEHYKDLVLGQIVPRLDSRVVETYVVDEASQYFPDAGSADAARPEAGRPEASRPDEPLDSTLDVVVRDNPESQTYDAMVGDEIAGTMLYEHEGPRLVLTHTAVQPRFQHHGLATTLIAAALDDIRSQGKKVTILCPTVTAFIDRHPEYADLVDPEHPGLTKERNRTEQAKQTE